MARDSRGTLKIVAVSDCLHRSGAGFALGRSLLTLLVAVAANVISIVAWPFRAALRWARFRHAARRAKIRRLVFIGLDGLDPALTERWMAEGKLPNLARLRETGGYRRLRTTYPGLSPVAWSTFATGVNPAKHNIFDFLARSPNSYAPELGPAKVRPPERQLGAPAGGIAAAQRDVLDHSGAASNSIDGAARAGDLPRGKIQRADAVGHEHARSERDAGIVLAILNGASGKRRGRRNALPAGAHAVPLRAKESICGVASL